MSRAGPFAPPSTARIFWAFSCGLPPETSARSVCARPCSSGSIAYSFTFPSRSSATWLFPNTVSSSMPSLPCTIIARSLPSRRSTSASTAT